MHNSVAQANNFPFSEEDNMTFSQLCSWTPDQCMLDPNCSQIPNIKAFLQLRFKQVAPGSCRHDLRLLVSMMHQVTLGADQLDDVIKFCAGDAGDQVNATLVGF